MLKWKLIFKKYERLALLLTVSTALTAALLNFDLNVFEAHLYDLRVSKSAQLKPDPNIVLITLDDTVTQALDEFAPLTLDYHALFMESLERLDPKAVGYLVDMSRVNQANPELFHTEWASRFVQSIRRLEARGNPVILGTSFDVTGEVLPPFPLSSLTHSLAIIHKDGNVFGEDNVTRRAMLEMNGKPAFQLDLAERMGFTDLVSRLRGSFLVPKINGKYFLFRYHGNTTNSPYPRVSFLDVLKGRLPDHFLAGKIALVGSVSKDYPSDFALTPYSKEPFTTPKLVVHANILDSLLHGQSLMRLPKPLNWLITFALSLFVLWWVLNSTPLLGLLATFVLFLSFIAVSQFIFQFNGAWIRESQPFLAIFLSYYLAVPYRLIREYKKRWDYQRKNQLLTQVEELKTNFLNLVTHDLKTPVARIQGLAEVLLRQAAVRLVDQDKETLHHIMRSTEELNHFISSILELSKVESQSLQIRFESKDINQLIERSLESFQAQAKAKRIQIQPSLEPLFPVKIDPALMSKVINNLIDNALKYSPQGSKIQVISREIEAPGGPSIEISVKDQGIGMSEEERENLFTRFYRAKNDTTAQTSGTGLGLYLTRYFVNAHHGEVRVESEPGKGSTFKIILPIAGPDSAFNLFKIEKNQEKRHV